MMRHSILVASLLALSLTNQAQQPQKNVLFLMADDFNFWLHKSGYYPQSITPHLDQLASQGVLFTNAQCSSPVCNPSRNALWSGLRPSTTGISTNGGGYVREITGFEDIVSMHQYFMDHDYFVYGAGKLWHPGRMGDFDTDPDHWTELYTAGTGAQGGSYYKWESAQDALFKWSAGDYDINESSDTKMARHIADLIETYDASEHRDQPFFIGCGFFRPHLPWNCPKQFYDLFDPDTLAIPQGYLENDLADINGASPASIHQEITGAGKWKEGIRAYLACMAYADYNVEIVLKAIEQSGKKENTIICFMGDHGWQLGEKDRWAKYAFYDGANNTTLIIYDPSAKGNGKICKKVVSLQDLYPTLVELAGLPVKTDIEGRSIAQLLDDPEKTDWEHPVLMTYNGTNIIKTNQWRYVDSDNSPQLYNMVEDPFEWTNLFGKPEYDEIVGELKHQIDSMVAIGQQIKSKLTTSSSNQELKRNDSVLKSSIANNHLLHLDLTNTGMAVNLSVYNMAGKLMQTERIPGEMDDYVLKLSYRLETGVYILNVKDEEREFSEKFVVYRDI